MKAVCYLRVSTSEQSDSGLGLEAQRTAIAAECTKRGWHNTQLFEDAGFSGATLNRPGIEEALAELDRCGPNAVLVAAKLDRIARSVLHFAEIMERSRKNGWALVCLDLGVDTLTAQGKFVASIFASFAELERDLISQRTKAALAVKKAQGVKLGRPPSIPPDVLKQIHELRKAGLSLRATAEHLNQAQVPTAQGGIKWWPETVRTAERHELL